MDSILPSNEKSPAAAVAWLADPLTGSYEEAGHELDFVLRGLGAAILNLFVSLRSPHASENGEYSSRRKPAYASTRRLHRFTPIR